MTDSSEPFIDDTDELTNLSELVQDLVFGQYALQTAFLSLLRVLDDIAPAARTMVADDLDLALLKCAALNAEHARMPGRTESDLRRYESEEHSIEDLTEQIRHPSGRIGGLL